MARVEIEKLEDVPEALRGEYKPSGGKFYLKLDDLTPEVPHPDLEKIRNAHANSKAERAKAEAEAKRLADELESTRAEMTKRLEEANPAAQIEGLRKSYEEREKAALAKALAPKEAEIQQLTSGIRDVMITKEALRIGTDLADNGDVLENFTSYIEGRLVVERDTNGKLCTRILSRDGQPSALTVDGLKEEISAMPRFKPLLKGSKASGGGAVGVSGGGGATGAQKPNFLTASPAEIDAWLERNKHQPGS